ncbi:aldose 1-epimerase [Ferruginibacter sp. HRS2-29]|uniref:aldose 1-epimerase n=1 Tax=Ferruginibacter sp. HRS2-29 TaxID=2487334 RepID=UPI0020CF7176|nr:aldose 1-epimerase [Ferruginibacter sp. HRS2-29]MCP9749894.1 aldose 1-epimerase [Ferruginibacter sp. HRS2-29]
MFSIYTQQLNGFDAVCLREDASGTTVTIVPACGGMLHGFEVKHEGELINVIDHYDDLEDYENNQASKGFKSAKLSPFACRLKDGGYHFEGQELRIEKFYLGKHAMHGLLFDVRFMVIKETAAKDKAGLKIEYTYRGEDPGYPFCYDCQVTYELGFDNYLTITTAIINKDQGSIPVMDGWHPYFTLGGSINDLQLEFQSKDKLVFDEEMLPSGKKEHYETFGSLEKIGGRKFDDCFTVNFAECQPMLVLREPVKRIQVEVYPHQSYPYLQLFTPDHRRSIAVENLSAAPDAFNNDEGLVTLIPGETYFFKTAYKVTSLI